MTPPSNNPFENSEPSNNPYAASKPSPATQAGVQTSPSGQMESGSMVRQVTVIAILMIVQSALLILLALMLVVMTIAMSVAIQAGPGAGGPGGGGPGQGQAEMWIFVVCYGGLALVILLVGSVQLFSAINLLKLKSYKFGIAALSVGLLAAFTCYCAPTAIGLTIYGLIVLLHPTTKRAFALVERGYSKEQVLRMFY